MTTFTLSRRAAQLPSALAFSVAIALSGCSAETPRLPSTSQTNARFSSSVTTANVRRLTSLSGESFTTSSLHTHCRDSAHGRTHGSGSASGPYPGTFKIEARWHEFKCVQYCKFHDWTISGTFSIISGPSTISGDFGGLVGSNRYHVSCTSWVAGVGYKVGSTRGTAELSINNSDLQMTFY